MMSSRSDRGISCKKRTWYRSCLCGGYAAINLFPRSCDLSLPHYQKYVACAHRLLPASELRAVGLQALFRISRRRQAVVSIKACCDGHICVSVLPASHVYEADCPHLEVYDVTECDRLVWAPEGGAYSEP